MRLSNADQSGTTEPRRGLFCLTALPGMEISRPKAVKTFRLGHPDKQMISISGRALFFIPTTVEGALQD